MNQLSKIPYLTRLFFQINIFIIIGNLVALVSILALPVHAKAIRSAPVEGKFFDYFVNRTFSFCQLLYEYYS